MNGQYLDSGILRGTGIGKALRLVCLMVLAAVLAHLLAPTTLRAEQVGRPDLEALIPLRFGEWRIDENAVQGIVNPQQQEVIDQIYSQTLARTYIHASGRRLMLSLAYGADQSHDNQIHKPEVCYPAQGFQILSSARDQVSTVLGPVPVMRIIASLGARREPVTYWIRVGEKVVRGAIEQNLARIGYGLSGVVPDGLLFRVSEISANPTDSFAAQDRFVNDLMKALPKQSSEWIVGNVLGD